jgi:DNA invertase Pin-like site-specific DNA recombinase
VAEVATSLAAVGMAMRKPEGKEMAYVLLPSQKLDRLARSVSHLVAIGGRLEAKAVALRVLEQAIDTSNCTGRLMFNMLGAIAQFERELMLERQREGIAKAKAEGKYRGRAPTARAKASDIRRLRSEGIGPTEIAKRLGISRASVYRVLNLSVMGPLRDPPG